VAIERARPGDACTAHRSRTPGASAVALDSQGPDAFTLRPAAAAELAGVLPVGLGLSIHERLTR
jgi:hypothetical protein